MYVGTHHAPAHAQCLRDPCGGARRRNTGGSGGRVIRSAHGHAGCSVMLITCLSRISFLRIFPPRAGFRRHPYDRAAAQGRRQTALSSNCVLAIALLNTTTAPPPDNGPSGIGGFCEFVPKDCFPGLDLPIIRRISTSVAFPSFSLRLLAARSPAPTAGE